jgi:hypothetical protein
MSRATGAVVEGLEARQLMAFTEPYISEFLTSNGTGIKDDSVVPVRTDWIEIHNPTSSPVNLAGWHLTDDKTKPAKWTFPSGTSGTTVPANGYLVVFADNTTTAVGPGGRLHANFALSNEGEYLALTRPDNSAVNSFDPYPAQATDVSYGTSPGGVTTVTAATPGAPARTLIPTGPVAGWTGRGFDDSAWIGGNTGVGYEVSPTINQFRARMVDTSSGSFRNVGQATAVLNGNLAGYAIAFDGIANNAAIDYGTGGSFAVNNALPNGLGGNTSGQPGREQYAMRVTANVFVPAGTWTFAVGSDAGFRLTLPGRTFTNKVNEDVGGPAGTLQWSGTRTAGVTMGTVTAPAGGVTVPMQLDYFDSSGADYLELSVASGSRSTFATGAANFQLLTNNLTPTNGATFTVSAPAAPQFAGLIGTNVPQMQNANASAYVRVPFAVNDPSSVSAMTLKMKYDDGYVAYLNGTEIARRNLTGSVGSPVAHNASAASDRANNLALTFEDVDVSAFTHLLVSGSNVLSIQALNSSAGDPNLLAVPQLEFRTAAVAADVQYMRMPTPGAANVGGALGVTKGVEFSADSGYYDAPFHVVLNTNQSNGTIWYTTDGRSPTRPDGTPSATASKYTSPIPVGGTATIRAVTLAAGFVPGNVDTRSYLFAQQVITAGDANNVAGFPSQWINGVNEVTSYPQGGQAKYGMTQTVVNQYGSSQMVAALKSLPVMSLVMNPDDLFGNGSAGTNGIRGIYSNPTTPDDANGTWERPTSAEFILPGGGDGFQIDAGVQIQGGGSRNPFNTPKHSLRLVFKDKYGPSKLQYEMFGNDGAEQYDALILKAQYNNTWLHWGADQRNRAQYVNDQWASDTALAMGDVSKRGRFVQLYLNGVYWGVYSVTERPDDSFASEYYGGPKEDYDVYSNEAVLTAGNSTAWTEMFNRARAGLTDPAAYEEFQQYLDVPAFIDFMLMNFYGGNQDWDDHNWYALRRSRNEGVATNQFGGFKFIVFDSERILEGVNDNRTTLNSFNRPTELFQLLRQNPEFRLAFADRAHELMFNGGQLSPAVATQRYLGLTEQIEDAMLAEQARWGNYRLEYHQYSGGPYVAYQRDVHWVNERNRLTVDDPFTAAVGDSYFNLRPSRLINIFRNPGAAYAGLLLYPTTDAPELNQHGGAVAAGFMATLAIPGGTPAGTVIYYTTDGSDPRVAVTGAVNPAAQQYTGAFAINASRRVQARAYNPNTGEWTALSAATFLVGPAPRLRVTEVMYNPAPPPASPTPAFLKDDYEFIELQNTGATPLDPSGIRFSEGIAFQFPDDSPLIPAGGRVVLVRNPAAFAERYGDAIAVGGTYTGELSDSGERLTLETGLGQRIANFQYNDGWFGQTDGDGYALVAIDPDASDAVLSTKEGWRTGQAMNGNPAGADPGLANNSVVVNEVMPTGLAGAGGNWIEFRNTTNAPIPIGGWFLSDDPLNRTKYTIPAGTVIPASGYWSIPQAGGFGGAFALSALGGAVYLTSNNGAGVVGGYRDAIDYGPSDPGVSFGKYVKGTGGSDFTAMTAPTRDAANAYPKVGPVVINEIMYNPFGLDREFVELRNVTGAAVSLAGWTFADGITYTFGAGASIPANGYALVVSIAPDVFRSTYGVPADVPIYGPFAGGLDGAGERLTLARPGAPVGDVTPLVTVDRVNYDNELPWPAAADGDGPSIARLNPLRYGNDVTNWRADAVGGSAGVANGFPPIVLANAFGYGASPAVTLQFGSDVGATVAKEDLAFVNRNTGQAVAASAIAFEYDAATHTATWRLAAGLADGHYRATMASSAVADAQGRELDGDGDGAAGGAFTYDFRHMGGDATGDGKVDFNDLVKLAQNYDTAGKAWADGDFTFDGAVDFNDLVVLAQRYDTTLPAPGAGAPVAASAGTAEAVAFARSMGLAVPATAVAPTPVVKPVTKPAKPVVAAVKPKAVERPEAAPRAVAASAQPAPAVGASFGGAFGKKRISDRVF